MVINTRDTIYSIGGMVINTQDTNYHPSGRVISIKSHLYIPSAENNFPPMASAPAEGTQYAAANFNLSLCKGY